ncbi:hypothetical protein GCM10027168_69210 [Streptomyces capparidis]
MRQALEDEAASQWQPRVRAQALSEQAATGLVISTRARFGFTSSRGSTDDPRRRRLTQRVSPATAAEILAARRAGASEQELTELVAAALGEAYFREGGNPPSTTPATAATA